MGMARTIMTVLNLRSEFERKNQRRPEEAEARGAATTEKADLELSRLVPAVQFVRHLYLVDSAGQLLGVAHADRALHDPPVDLFPMLQSLVRVNLGGGLRRVFFETDSGIAVLLRVVDDRWLAAVCEKGASLGTVSVGVGKLVASLIPPKGNGKPAGSAN
jgi:hypothetical protein